MEFSFMASKELRCDTNGFAVITASQALNKNPMKGG